MLRNFVLYFCIYVQMAFRCDCKSHYIEVLDAYLHSNHIQIALHTSLILGRKIPVKAVFYIVTEGHFCIRST
jgi:hypothetical protein